MREPLWATADSALLTEFEPELGAVTPERTVVKVLASADVLVFGIRCDDPDPDRITSFSRARDADLSAEDHARIVLDPFLNEQSGYVFAVNPDGARYDALITEQAQRLGGRENPDWDTIWEASAARSVTGWSVEIRIPIKSLLYKPGLTEWGFNVQRRVQRKLETERWAFPATSCRSGAAASACWTGRPCRSRWARRRAAAWARRASACSPCAPAPYLVSCPRRTWPRCASSGTCSVSLPWGSSARRVTPPARTGAGWRAPTSCSRAHTYWVTRTHSWACGA